MPLVQFHVCELRQAGATIMTMISRRKFRALLSLCVVSVMARGVVADEIADWMAEMRRQNDEFNRQAQEEREARDRFNREAYEEREARDKFNREAYAEREARDRFNREAQEARDAMDKFNREAHAERDAWYQWNRDVQQARDNERKQQEWDDWLNRLTGRGEAAGPAAGSVAVAEKSNSKASVARSAAARRFWFRAHTIPPQPLLILNPYVSQSKVSQNQEQAAEQLTRPQITSGRQESSQVIQNPFVSSTP